MNIFLKVAFVIFLVVLLVLLVCGTILIVLETKDYIDERRSEKDER